MHRIYVGVTSQATPRHATRALCWLSPCARFQSKEERWKSTQQEQYIIKKTNDAGSVFACDGYRDDACDANGPGATERKMPSPVARARPRSASQQVTIDRLLRIDDEDDA